MSTSLLRRNVFFCSAITSLLLFLAACGRSPKQAVIDQISIAGNNSDYSLLLSNLNVARCPGSWVSRCWTRENTSTFELLSALDCDQLVSFYREDMEVRGWNVIDVSSDEEGMLVCQVGRRTSVVSIRNKQAPRRTIMLNIRT